MTTLKEVQLDKKKLSKFIKEREKDTPCADKERFDATLQSMTQGKCSTSEKSSD